MIRPYWNTVNEELPNSAQSFLMVASGFRGFLSELENKPEVGPVYKWVATTFTFFAFTVSNKPQESPSTHPLESC
jgi:hypothetical protein